MLVSGFESIIHECQCLVISCLRRGWDIEEKNGASDIHHSRSMVQLSRHEIFGTKWILQLLGLV